MKNQKRIRKCAERIMQAFNDDPTLSEAGEYNSKALKKEFKNMIHLCKGAK